ncbi:NAD(P)/FAD-dependent oxidoreductase [Dongia rigui]|uniref:FAD-binding oxidoreductase n=1 Tax=Dongia rigui TaxID=940149 RepID=A0ABU5DUN6_9PROT|nr:FAD-binding oxidoreductase [Dongia rigui]MDY0871016.1 FAD-binding oxidoreductase [Dongia rigui]
MADRPHVIVVGAGIIGASIAWHLARDGAKVTIIEADQPGGIATRHSWAWLNASWGNPEPYFRLRIRAMAEWKRLAKEVPAIRLHWLGGLIYDLPPGELDAYATQHSTWGYGIRRVTADEISRMEPALKAPPAMALHVAEEGALEPLATAQALLAAAVGLGAELQHASVTGIDMAAGNIVGIVTAQRRIAADQVVVAAGTATTALAATAGVNVPTSAPPGLLVATKPTTTRLNGLVMAPDMHVRQLEDGRLLAGAHFGGSDPGSDAAGTARTVFTGLQAMLTGGDTLAFDRYQIGHRPMPADGFPIVGPAPDRPGLYLAVTHSGITLAPAIGLFAAAEILGRQRDPLLAPYGPGRFGISR